MYVCIQAKTATGEYPTYSNGAGPGRLMHKYVNNARPRVFFIGSAARTVAPNLWSWLRQDRLHATYARRETNRHCCSFQQTSSFSQLQIYLRDILYVSICVDCCMYICIYMYIFVPGLICIFVQLFILDTCMCMYMKAAFKIFDCASIPKSSRLHVSTVSRLQTLATLHAHF